MTRILPATLFRWMPRRQAAFEYPVGPAPRTAVLVDWLERAGSRPGRAPVRTFAQGWCGEAEVFAPEALAGTRDQLLELAAGAAPPLTHAVIALQRAGEPLLSAGDRERLWRAFHVPVFEQIIGERGQLLAAECEAHDGLHIAEGAAPEGPYWLERAACGCGQKTPRLSAALERERERAAAVYAR